MSDELEREAEARHERHIGHPTHRPLSDGYELVGLRGEEELARVFGESVDMTPRPGGDGGKDITLRLATALGPHTYPIDVKAARKPGNLIVERGKVQRFTIYVLAGYSDVHRKAELLGWEWGAVLLAAPVRDFGYGVINHYIPRRDLRRIAELIERRSLVP